MIVITVDRLFWKFVQSMALILPCCVQDYKHLDNWNGYYWVNKIALCEIQGFRLSSGWIFFRNFNLYPDSKDHGANMGPTWVRSVSPRWAPCRPHEPCYLHMSSVGSRHSYCSKSLLILGETLSMMQDQLLTSISQLNKWVMPCQFWLLGRKLT